MHRFASSSTFVSRPGANALIIAQRSDSRSLGVTRRRPLLHAVALLLALLMVASTASAQFLQQGSKLVGTGATSPADQGRSVALSADGNTAIVGGDADNSGAGAAWVHIRSNGVWSQQGTKLVGGGATGSFVQQGISVAVSADGNT